MLSNMKENIPVHQFELVEDEEEVDSADEEEEEEEGMMDEGMIDEEAEEGEEGEGGGRTPAEATPGTRTDDRMAQRNQSSTPQVLLRTPGTQQRPASATPDVGVALAMRTLGQWEGSQGSEVRALCWAGTAQKPLTCPSPSLLLLFVQTHLSSPIAWLRPISAWARRSSVARTTS